MEINVVLIGLREKTMQHDWVMNVLADVKTFAQCNGLDRLAEHLDDTMMVATAELSASARCKSDEASAHVEKSGTPRVVSGAGPNS